MISYAPLAAHLGLPGDRAQFLALGLMLRADPRLPLADAEVEALAGMYAIAFDPRRAWRDHVELVKKAHACLFPARESTPLEEGSS